MQQIKKTAEYLLFKKKTGRYAVKSRKDKKWLHDEEKVKILVAEGLLTLPEPKAAPAAEEGEAAAE